MKEDLVILMKSLKFQRLPPGSFSSLQWYGCHPLASLMDSLPKIFQSGLCCVPIAKKEIMLPQMGKHPSC